MRLKNGGMLRGTIAESGGDFVTIVLFTGEMRKVPAADVTYAGPAASAPVAPPSTAPAIGLGTQPFSTAQAPEARVRFVSEPTGSSLWRRRGKASFTHNGFTGPSATGYDEVCTAPCIASMPAGTHTFALAKPQGDRIEATPITLRPGNSTLAAKYVDKKGKRIGLAIVGTAAMVGGLVLELTALPSSSAPDSSVAPAPFFGGLALQAGGLVLILCARLVKDRFELSVAPGAGATPPVLAPAANSARAEPRFFDRSAGGPAIVRDGLAGLHVTARF